MHPLVIIGLSAAAVFVVCWIVFSRVESGPGHSVAVWIGGIAIYVTVGCLLGRVGQLAWSEGLLAAQVGFGALVVVVLGWHVVSFSSPGPGRAVVECLSASGLYLTLLSLFTHFAYRAWEQDNTVAVVGFGFLVLLFGSGLLVSLAHTLLQLRGSARQQQSATN